MGATVYAIPALTVLMSWGILGEVPSWPALAGGTLCLAGVAIGRRPRHVHGSHSDDQEVSLEYPAGGHNGTRRSGTR
jgi:hypothetical protein